jgi:hypothetical protein
VKSTCTLLLGLGLLLSAAAAQNPPASPSTRTDVYHVHFAVAASGKASQLADYLKQQGPNAPMPGHHLVLRHQSGAEWDYVAIEHLGTKATVDASAAPPPPAVLSAGAWHGDTFVAGPPWQEFARAMGIADQSAGKTAGSVYVVSIYRAVPGHRDQLEKVVSAPPGGNAGSVLLQHLEGGSWQYLTVVRYDSWQDFAKEQQASVAQTAKSQGPWFELREHATFHTDTLADRIAPAVP